jgi:hypothetical protein
VYLLTVGFGALRRFWFTTQCEVVCLGGKSAIRLDLARRVRLLMRCSATASSLSTYQLADIPDGRQKQLVVRRIRLDECVKLADDLLQDAL